MKRSEINDIIRAGDDFIRSFGFRLPPFAYWSPEEMRARRAEIGGIVGARLGWDITDFGQERFAETGLFLFTMRNGSEEDLRRGGGMCYAEKIMISRQGQVTPLHRHIVKAEDIINRGGGVLALKLFDSDAEGKVDEESEVEVATDGVLRRQAAGAILRLRPGESVTLRPGNWHAFWGEEGDVLVGEVSTVNNDLTDNIFADPVGRFAEIEEDEAPLHLLVSDYPKWFA
ncbi:D-lyxose/D-mannose family sugar isomerase [Amaricoccus sp.]|uniref:D-lyxose/D-mannose family sugar isomerase n=1 Tax=Amaricoccus sp. TaxID=1872485 RepID=UPI00263412FC|nr:D-lyxose/D-mannose family sugar isomerase [Amaricoccus sp.]HRO10462.1 D-lyxose/D-mannose family sugar isomerase [Amaricoccus sp.]